MQRLLKYILLIFTICMILTSILLIINIFRVSSEDIIKVMKNDIKEGMVYSDIKKILDKYEFKCKGVDKITCYLHTSTRIPLASCEHKLYFNIKNNKSIELIDKVDLCAGL
jgi:hypothetical protein